MRRSPVLFAAFFYGTCLATGAHATDERSVLPPVDSPAPPPKADMKRAMDACAAAVAKDAHGGPDRLAMDKCLADKGVANPHERGPPPPPPAPPESGESVMPPPPPMAAPPPAH